MANRGKLRGAKLRPLRETEKANPRVTWGRKTTGPELVWTAGLPWLLVVDESLDAHLHHWEVLSMRKLFTLTLAVIFVSTLSVVGLAMAGPQVPETTSTSQNVPVSFGVGQHLSLSIMKGNKVDFGENLDPTETYTKEKATMLKVKSNPNIKWEISSSKPKSKAASYLHVTFDNQKVYKGHGTKGGIPVDYSLDKMEDLETGDYNVTVTFTVATT